MMKNYEYREQLLLRKLKDFPWEIRVSSTVQKQSPEEFSKTVLLKISKMLQEKTCVRVSMPVGLKRY